MFVNVCKMFTLQLKGCIVASKNALQKTLLASIGRMLQFSHSLLQLLSTIRETFHNCSGVRGAASNVVVRVVRIENRKLERFSFVNDIRPSLWEVRKIPLGLSRHSPFRSMLEEQAEYLSSED